MGFSGIDAELNKVRKQLKAKKKEGVAEVGKAVNIFMSALMARTPVWSGETVLNYTVGLGGFDTAYKGGGSPPSTPQGPDTPMGGEQMRASAEGTAMARANSVVASMGEELQSAFITNNVSPAKWDLIDNGSAPTKDRARNPGGVSATAILVGKQALGGNWK